MNLQHLGPLAFPATNGQPSVGREMRQSHNATLFALRIALMSRRRGNGSGKLKDEHKAFVVQRLAVFDSPKQAADALRAEYRVEISPQGAEAYDPGKHAGRALSDRWRTVFETVREGFLNQLYQVPESHKAVRVKYLARASQVYKERGAYLQMARMLEQIAKEMGDVYGSRRGISEREGRSIQVADMSDEQIDQELKQIFAQSGLALVPIN